MILPHESRDILYRYSCHESLFVNGILRLTSMDGGNAMGLSGTIQTLYIAGFCSWPYRHRVRPVHRRSCACSAGCTNVVEYRDVWERPMRPRHKYVLVQKKRCSRSYTFSLKYLYKDLLFLYSQFVFNNLGCNKYQ